MTPEKIALYMVHTAHDKTEAAELAWEYAFSYAREGRTQGEQFWLNVYKAIRGLPYDNSDRSLLKDKA